MLEIILMARALYQHPPYSYPWCSHLAVPFSFSSVDGGELELNDDKGAGVNFPDKAATEVLCDSNFLAAGDLGSWDRKDAIVNYFVTGFHRESWGCVNKEVHFGGGAQDESWLAYSKFVCEQMGQEGMLRTHQRLAMVVIFYDMEFNKWLDPLNTILIFTVNLDQSKSYRPIRPLI